jgi:hypothetical protein
MNDMPLRVFRVFGVFLALNLYAQNSGIVDWLTNLQQIERDLQSSAQQPAAEAGLRSLAREVARMAAMRPDPRMTLPELPPAGASAATLGAYAAGLRQALEEMERKRPGGAFNAGRTEVAVSATPLQVVTAKTLDESDHRLRNLPKMADALNQLAGVTTLRCSCDGAIPKLDACGTQLRRRSLHLQPQVGGNRSVLVTVEPGTS